MLKKYLKNENFRKDTKHLKKTYLDFNSKIFKLKKSIIINLLTIITLSGCQDNLELDKTIDQAEYFENKKEVSPILSEKFYKLTTFQSSNKTPPFISNNNKRLNIKKIKERRSSREQSTEFNEIATIKTEQMPTPFLPPSGKNQVDLFLTMLFFIFLKCKRFFELHWIPIINLLLILIYTPYHTRHYYMVLRA